MEHAAPAGFLIREARPAELAELGRSLVEAYASLAAMPSVEEQPDYYGMLREVARRAANPAITVLAAVTESGELLGSVDFIAEMQQYGSAGSARDVPDAAGIRLLAVKREARGRGVGRALTEACLQRARELRRSQVILHTTRAMATAWTMYERLGFERFPQIDFTQGRLEVFGFRLPLDR